MPISIRDFVGLNNLLETKANWQMWGDMCRFVFEHKLSDGRQCNPDNFLVHPKTKKISMKTPAECEVLDQYTAQGSQEAVDVFGLGLILQFMLTTVEEVPLRLGHKELYRLTEQVWQLITEMVSNKTCTTYDATTRSAWWAYPPSHYNDMQKRQIDKDAKAELVKTHEAKSMFNKFKLPYINKFIVPSFVAHKEYEPPKKKQKKSKE